MYNSRALQIIHVSDQPSELLVLVFQISHAFQVASLLALLLRLVKMRND